MQDLLEEISLGSVAGVTSPSFCTTGWREEIRTRRKEQKQATLERRFQYNLDPAINPTRGELGSEL
jgi:hypothetical protein